MADNQWFGGLGSQYQQLLGRPMDASGRDYWSNLDSTTDLTDDQLQTQFMQGVNAEMGQRNPGTPSGTYGFGSNPYQGGQAGAITSQYQQFLDKNLAGINSGAVAAGGLGGGRQGVAQGEAIGTAASGLSGALANLYGSNWNAEQGRDVQRQGLRDNFYLGNRNADLTELGIGTNFYSNLLNTGAGYGGGDNDFDWQKAIGGGLSGFGYAGQNGWWK